MRAPLPPDHGSSGIGGAAIRLEQPPSACHPYGSESCPYDMSSRWHIPSLQHWSQVAAAANESLSTTHTETRRPQQYSTYLSTAAMGTAASTPQESHAKAELRTSAKPAPRMKLSANTSDHKRVRCKVRNLRQPSTLSETRAGASLNLPIAVDSDDELHFDKHGGDETKPLVKHD